MHHTRLATGAVKAPVFTVSAKKSHEQQPRPEHTPFLTDLHEHSAEGPEGHSVPARSPMERLEDDQGTEVCPRPCRLPGMSLQTASVQVPPLPLVPGRPWTSHCTSLRAKFSSCIMVKTAPPWMNLEGIMLSEISQSQKGKYHRIPFIPRGVKFTETGSRRQVARGCGRGRGSLCLTGRVSEMMVVAPQ